MHSFFKNKQGFFQTYRRSVILHFNIRVNLKFKVFFGSWRHFIQEVFIGFGGGLIAKLLRFNKSEIVIKCLVAISEYFNKIAFFCHVSLKRGKRVSKETGYSQNHHLSADESILVIKIYTNIKALQLFL